MYGVGDGMSISWGEGERLIRIAPEYLAKTLHLPEGAEITGAEYDYQGSLLFLRVKHKDFKGLGTEEGGNGEVDVLYTATRGSDPDRIESKWRI